LPIWLLQSTRAARAVSPAQAEPTTSPSRFPRRRVRPDAARVRVALQFPRPVEDDPKRLAQADSHGAQVASARLPDGPRSGRARTPDGARETWPVHAWHGSDRAASATADPIDTIR